MLGSINPRPSTLKFQVQATAASSGASGLSEEPCAHSSSGLRASHCRMYLRQSPVFRAISEGELTLWRAYISKEGPHERSYGVMGSYATHIL